VSRPAPRRRLVLVALPVVALLGVAGFAAPVVFSHSAGHVTLTGVADHAVLGAAGRDHLRVGVRATGLAAKDLAATVDGRSVALTSQGSGGEFLLTPGPLADGAHVISVHGATLHLTIDSTPPQVAMTLPTHPVPISSRVQVSGSLESPTDRVSAPGGTVTMQGAGFTVSYPTPPAGATITVTDQAGNTTVRSISVPTAYPTGIRAVHMTGAAWAYAPLREPVLRLISQHRINAVELDIKDEDGIVNFDTPVPLAHQDGAIFAYYDARQVTQQLHAMGARVIGREVTFNDTKFADWAWSHSHRDWVIQTPDGLPYSYGYRHAHFANFASSNARDYEVAIAKSAVTAGFDDVIFDYIRRPDGPIGAERFPGLASGASAESAAELAIADFAKRAQAVLRPLGGSVGAAIFAQASTRPQDTAQNVPMMAKYLDVVVPMDYPSHWNNGEYGVPDPFADPYAIVNRSLKDWLKAVHGTNCVVVPWLQDEDYRGHYGPEKVIAQIKGTRDDGIPGWLMWSAKATYTQSAFSADAPKVFTSRS